MPDSKNESLASLFVSAFVNQESERSTGIVVVVSVAEVVVVVVFVAEVGVVVVSVAEVGVDVVVVSVAVVRVVVVVVNVAVVVVGLQPPSLGQHMSPSFVSVHVQHLPHQAMLTGRPQI